MAKTLNDNKNKILGALNKAFVSKSPNSVRLDQSIQLKNALYKSLTCSTSRKQTYSLAAIGNALRCVEFAVFS